MFSGLRSKLEILRRRVEAEPWKLSELVGERRGVENPEITISL